MQGPSSFTNLEDDCISIDISVEASDSEHISHSRGSTDNVSGATSEDKNDIKAKLAKQETTKVDISRAMVLCILVLAATAISIVVYYISKHAESEQVETQYEGVASKVLDSFETITYRIGIINSIGVAATGHGMGQFEGPELDSNSSSTQNSSWPFVTLPSFEHESAVVRSLSSALYLSIHPIVSDETRDRWEKYTVGKANTWM